MTHPDSDKELGQNLPELENLPTVAIEDLWDLAYKDIMTAVDTALSECESCCLDNPEDKQTVRDRLAHHVKEIIYS